VPLARHLADWQSGVRFPPLASLAWIEADGTPVTGDEAVIATFHPRSS